ncbi:hypothetical protein [Carboxylicivirga sp. N1Y90]
MNKYLHAGFENIEVYNLICNILTINPSENDGKFDNLKSMLHQE